MQPDEVTSFFRNLLTLIICSEIPPATAFPSGAPVPPHIEYDVMNGYTLVIKTPERVYAYKLTEADFERTPTALLAQLITDIMPKPIPAKRKKT